MLGERHATFLSNYPGQTRRLFQNHHHRQRLDHGDAISTWPNTVAPIKAMKWISEEDKEKILDGNAMRLVNKGCSPLARSCAGSSSLKQSRPDFT